jgi:hypothetical protein
MDFQEMLPIFPSYVICAAADARLLKRDQACMLK